MKNLLLIIMLCCAAMAHAYKVSGKVTDASSGEALPLATFRIFAANDTVHPVVNDITDTEGLLSTDLSDGQFILTVEYVSKKTLEKPFTVAGKDLDLGNLPLADDSSTLQEVTVVARKDLISSDGAKLTYDAERDPSAATSSILELLRKVPMVTVDGEDNIKVKGNSSFKIYINGKPDPMLSGDPSTVLKSMPASSIKRIEVITDPGAKYDAEGVAGILNIIMDKQQRLAGYNANARLGIMSNGMNGSLYGRTKVGNVTGSVQMNYYDNSNLWRNAYSYSNSERTDYSNDNEHKYTSDSKSVGKNRYVGGNINLSWEPDTLNLFTFGLRYYNGNSNSEVDQHNRMANIQDAPVWSYSRHFSTKNSWNGWVPSFSYQHTFPNNTQHYLTFSYQYSGGGSKYYALQNSFDFFGMPGADTPWMSTDNNWDSSEHTFQIDYALPITDKQTFEAGGKVLLRHPNGNSGYYAGPDETVQHPSSVYDLTQINDLYALYATYNASFGRFSGRAGLRYEHSRMGLRYHQQLGSSWPDFTSNLNDWIPNASLTYKITDQSNLRAAYSMRIERPYLGQLSPVVNDLTYGSLSYGNPDLKTAHANNFELKYSNYGGKFSGEVSVSYSQTNDAVAQLSFMKDGVEHQTYENIGRSAMTNINGYLAYQITSAMDASLYAGTHYNDFKSDKGLILLHSHGWSWNMGGNYSYTTPFKMRIDVWGGYGSGNYYMQNKGSSWYYWGLSLSRSFLKNDMLTLSLNTNDLLPARWKSKYYSYTETSKTVTHTNSRNWSFGLTVSVKFGNLRQDVKRTNANINNNDGVTGNQSGGK